VPRRGAGGLVSGLGPAVVGTDTVWVAAAMTDADREAAESGLVEAEGFRIRSVVVDPAEYRMAYDVVANATLWFVHHGLFERATRPRFDTGWRRAWAAYRSVNTTFAAAVAEVAPDDAIVLVQDMHLTLLAEPLERDRPDLSTVHFTHTPFAGPDELRILPDDVAEALLEGMAAHDACGFHTQRWADAYRASCRAVLDLEPPAFVAPLSSDPDDLATVAASAQCATALDELNAEVGDRQVVARVDRIELSKNLLRGFYAFDDLLTRHPNWRDRVVFAASVYPSREGLAEYLAYAQEVETVVASINARWGTESWTPVLLDTSDDFPRSVAVLRRSDVLLVNPIRDGLNLVAKEGALVNERNGVLCLSPEAGAWDELAEASLRVHPYDVSGTADVLDRALSLPADERATLAARCRTLVEARTPTDWLADQVAAAG
jgi:trehalose 6-phosphate synthase